MTLTIKYFNQSGENFVTFNRQNNAATCREHLDATENDAFEAMLTRLVLENGDFVGDTGSHKVFFTSGLDLPVAKINNSLKAS